MQGDVQLADPGSLGLSGEKIEELVNRVRQEVDEGLLPSVQYALAKDGQLALFESYGDADNSAMYCIFSATKAITSAAAWLLIQEGKLDISRKVAEFIPEFAANNKQDITIEQVFLHTAGFPHAPFRVTDWLDKSRRLERYADNDVLLPEDAERIAACGVR